MLMYIPISKAGFGWFSSQLHSPNRQRGSQPRRKHAIGIGVRHLFACKDGCWTKARNVPG